MSDTLRTILISLGTTIVAGILLRIAIPLLRWLKLIPKRMRNAVARRAAHHMGSLHWFAYYLLGSVVLFASGVGWLVTPIVIGKTITTILAVAMTGAAFFWGGYELIVETHARDAYMFFKRMLIRLAPYVEQRIIQIYWCMYVTMEGEEDYLKIVESGTALLKKHIEKVKQEQSESGAAAPDLPGE